MSQVPNKNAIRTALVARLRADLEALTQSQRDAHEGATHEEAKPESDKDTRATEASYLARGLAQRVEQLHQALRKTQTLALRSFDEDSSIGLSALVWTSDENDHERLYFIAPAGGGIKLAIADQTVIVVSPGSPLGGALIGKSVDDEAAIPAPTGRRLVDIIRVI